MLVHSIVKYRLLDLAGWPASHGEAAPSEDPFMGLECQEFLGFFIKWNCPEGMHSIHFEEKSFSMELLDFVRCQRKCACDGF